MSDSIEDLVKHYNESVHDKALPRSIGLFTIPEYPELEAERGMWSAALDAILTTLRYLAPATLLTLFWGQQSFLFKILKHIDSAFRSIFSSEEEKQAVLQWLAEAGPVKVDHLDTVWRHGWILCRVLDAALPGACAGHPPANLSIKHAQAIAEHYLGVEPVFTRQELESNDSLSRHQEWKFATYLDRIREALSKLTPPVSKPVSQRTTPEIKQSILDYVVRGCGLSAIQINNKAHFKIYPTSQQSLDPGEITVLIRGPRDAYGMTVIPPILGKAQMIRQKILGLQSKQTYTENILPVTQGATYLRNFGKNDMHKTYYIPKSQYDIDIDVDSQFDHVKVSYAVKYEGKYLVSITSRDQSIVGSPFTVTATENILSVLEKDSFYLEDGEEIDIVDVQTDKKVVLRIVDFVTEKMLLKENGTLEKISDEEAKILMSVNNEHNVPSINMETRVETANKTLKNHKIKEAALKIITMYRICKIFHKLIINKQLKLQNEIPDSCIHRRNQQDIPDIVNSTFAEINVNPYIISEIREKFIVPECISVSLTAEKSKTRADDIINDTLSDEGFINNPVESTRIDTPDSLEAQNSCCEDDQDSISIDRAPTPTEHNPFLNEIFEDDSLQLAAESKFGTFVASEYETNNSLNEVTKDSSIKIMIDSNSTPSPVPSSLPTLVHRNPFIEADVTDFERPKTPVFKIISGEKLNRTESVFIDPKSESLITEENLGNEFVNPFFMHQFQSDNFDETPVTDFIIGAAVSLPPIILASSPDPEMKSLISPQNSNTEKHEDNFNTHENYIAVISEPVYSRLDLTSLESISTETINNSNASSASDNQFEADQTDSIRNVTSRKDLWDSAYVSIDDNNSSPDNNNNNNNNESTSLCDKHVSPSEDNTGLKLEEITNMGPAEKEIWQTCNELNSITNKLPEDIKPKDINKWEVKRPLFTPIIEETDRSISASIRYLSTPGICTKQVETDTVSVAFAELNEMYQEYFPISEINSTTMANDDNKLYSVEVGSLEVKGISVDSASDISDVKRHENDLEGTISEVQASVTESVSVSQILHKEKDHSSKNNQIEKHFGGNSYSNIVLEKKKYWDDRIREIEAKAQEITVPKKRRISAKQLKHDSLSKRKGKQIIKSFLSAGDYSQVKNVNQNDDREPSNNTPTTIQSISLAANPNEALPDEKLVAKWKKYWDDKLEDQIQIEISNPRTKTSKIKFRTPSPEPNREQNLVKEVNLKTCDSQTHDKISTNDQFTPIKQELPEEVFKAFETSPKRFFGTSRKQILNKIDTFLGKPVDVDISTTNVAMCHESGLVSSRISLFHNISNTEELPWGRRKTQSLHDIYQVKESENNMSSAKHTSNLEKERDTNLQVSKEIAPVIETNNINTVQYNNFKKEREKIIQDPYKILADVVNKTPIAQQYTQKQNQYVTSANKNANDKYQPSRPKIEALRKKSFSKSEMDIFNKSPSNIITDLDKYKSCDELPKINVKSFISLYESVSKSIDRPKPVKRVYRTSSTDSQKTYSNSITSDAVPKRNYTVTQGSGPNNESKFSTPEVTTPTNLWTSKTSETVSNMSLDTRTSDSYDVEIMPNDSKDAMYLSLSDIELEIIESSPSKSSKFSPERELTPEHIEYKNRFKLAKEYFQSLEELREIKKPRKLNECELLLRKHSVESLEKEQTKERPQNRVKKNIKSHSLPSSEIAKGLNQLQERQERCASEESSNTKLVKISEKFNVEDLFSDVTEGKFSRQGSLRGIPHKKAVLEAFRSMENVSDITMSSYEMADSHLSDFSKEHRVKNAQTYLNEYPYLPKTDPSKYHSRIDIKASGLISLKELKEKKPRRNSVPDLRLNPDFTVDV